MNIDKSELASLVAQSICADEDFKDKVRQRVAREFDERQSAAIRLAITEMLETTAQKVAEHLTTAKFRRTNQWGEPESGEPLSLAAWVEAELHRQAGDHYSNKNLLAAMMKTANKAVTKEVGEIVAAQKDAIRKAVADMVAQKIVEHSKL